MSLETDTCLVFYRVNLDRALFNNTNLTRAFFQDVDWYRHKSLLTKRMALWGEFRDQSQISDQSQDLDSSYEYETLITNYRQLASHYHRIQAYVLAEDFHVGEMEMRRKYRFMTTGVPWLNGYALYKLLSNYGTSYWRATFVLLVLFLLLSGGFLLSEFSVPGADGEERFVEYNLLPIGTYHLLSPKQIPQWTNDFWKACILILSIVFQRQQPYQPAGDLGILLSITTIIILPAQTTLIGWVIARKFRLW